MTYANAHLDAFFDGLCEPRNPGGTATFGWIIFNLDGNVLADGRGFVAHGAKATNNVAEYSALIRLLEYIEGMTKEGRIPREIDIRGDSMLVIRQVAGEWACRPEHLQRAVRKVRELTDAIEAAGVKLALEWVPRESNVAADQLSRLAYKEWTGREAPVRQRRRGIQRRRRS